MSDRITELERKLLVYEVGEHLSQNSGYLRLRLGAHIDLARRLIEDYGVQRCSSGELVTSGGQNVVEFIGRAMAADHPHYFVHDAPVETKPDYSGLTAAQKLARANGDEGPKL